MKIYNTLSGRKEEFIPQVEGHVNMYACGITVSGEAHIGHAYQALIYDIIRKFLEKCGYTVDYARNYTDVDDKIIAKSHETGIPADKYAEMMIEKIDHEMQRLQVDEPTRWLKATCCIEDIIDFIKVLIQKGHAYATADGDVYFSVESFKGYGKLSHRNLEDALSGVRIESEESKKNALDFALWKSAKAGEIFWESPWGKGRPGWHIECSAMNRKAFGECLDIHGGGRDLIFPHHENEIAQSEALSGKPFAKYWIHNGLIKVNGQKMSKSLGNSLLLSDLLDKYDPETIKFALLQTNYRNDINVTDNLFPDADKHMYEFYKVIRSAEEKGLQSEDLDSEIDEKFNRGMGDDFNTACVLADLFGYFKKIKAKINAGDNSAMASINQIRKTYSLLGLFRKPAKDFIAYYEEKTKEEFPQEVVRLAELRLEAKRNKDYQTADKLRAEITALGYAVKDTKDGYTLAKA